LSLEMAPQDGPAGRDSHVSPRSLSGASRDQYGVTVQVRFSTVLGKDRPSPSCTVRSKFLKYAVMSQAWLLTLNGSKLE